VPSAASDGARVLVPVFDLDQTLWAGNSMDWDPLQLRKWEPTTEREHRSADRLQVYQEDVGFLELHREVALIFRVLRGLRDCGAKFGIASASTATATVHALLCEFGLCPSELFVETREGHEEEDGKEQMLRRLSERLGAPADTLVLFDDQKEHLTKAREALHAGGRLIDPTVGLTADALLSGLDFHRRELSDRVQSGLNVKGFTAHEMAIENAEERRKAQQSRHGREGERHAAEDEAPARAQMQSLRVEAGFWLSVPLTTEGAFDWQHVSHVREYSIGGQANGAGGFRKRAECKWPSIRETNVPLVAEHWHSVGGADAEGGHVLARLGLCALMRHKGAGQHSDLFMNVAVHTDGTVSGDKRTRGINVSAMAETRTQRADGRHVTEGTRDREGYDQRLVHVVPIKSADIDVLRLVRHLVWRMQSLALVVQLDGLRSLDPTRTCLPADATPVPLSLLAAALTHREAAAEAPELPHVEALNVFGLPAVRDASRVDVRGCCDCIAAAIQTTPSLLWSDGSFCVWPRWRQTSSSSIQATRVLTCLQRPM
jgi:hypothetical protein